MSIQEGIIYGDQNIVLPVHLNYGRHFLERILKHRDKIALIDGTTGEEITYAKMAQQIINVAGNLKRMDVRPGEVVGICSENRIEVIIATFAASYIGAVVTFINSGYGKNEIYHVINISRPRYMFLSPAAYEKHFKTLSSLKMARKFFVFGESPNKFSAVSFTDLIKEHTDIKSIRPADNCGNNVTCFILYSSGTTGLAKGAKITHLNMIVASQQPEPCSRDLKMLIVAPWCSCMGLLVTTDSLYGGKTIVFLPRFHEKLYLETIEKYKIGFLLYAPPLVVMLSQSTILENYDLSSVQTLWGGGAPLDLDTMNQVKERFPNLRFVLQGYGMTETTGSIAEELETQNKLGSVGKITPGNIVKIADIETRKILGPNQSGEVCVKGPALFAGYVGKTQELDEDGFYRTGDIAYYDEDGFFFVVDRLKELIKYKAWQVPPSELEALILQHPAIKDVGVIGIPDKLAGEIPFAFVVKKGRVTEKEVMDYVASKVAPWKQLRGGVRFVNEIPKNPSGKILRRQLREMLKSVPTSRL